MIRATKGLLIAFAGIEILLFVLIHFVDTGIRSGVLHYLSIVLCAALVFVVKDETPALTWTRIGFFFTLGADWFLTYRHDEQFLGTLLFLFAQLAFAKRLLSSETHPTPWILLRILLFGAGLIAASVLVTGLWDGLLVTALLYYALLVSNAVHASFRWNHSMLFAVGLLFYVGCDTLVGLSQSAAYLSIPVTSIWYALLHAPIDLIWVFYLPSQALIAASALLPLITQKKRMAV